MEPLLDEDTEGSGNECDEETQYPEGVNNRKNPRSVERRNIEQRDSRVDEIPIDGEVGRLVDELHEENIGKVFRLLLEVLV